MKLFKVNLTGIYRYDDYVAVYAEDELSVIRYMKSAEDWMDDAFAGQMREPDETIILDVEEVKSPKDIANYDGACICRTPESYEDEITIADAFYGPIDHPYMEKDIDKREALYKGYFSKLNEITIKFNKERI